MKTFLFIVTVIVPLVMIGCAVRKSAQAYLSISQTLYNATLDNRGLHN
jgi:hypothetical protein